MSLILEALRKSDAERRLGSAPDLLAPMPVLRSPPPRRHWPLLVAAAAALLVVIVLFAGWWSRTRTTTPSNSVPVVGPLPLPAQSPAVARTALPVVQGEVAPAPVVSEPSQTPPPVTLPTTKPARDAALPQAQNAPSTANAPPARSRAADIGAAHLPAAIAVAPIAAAPGTAGATKIAGSTATSAPPAASAPARAAANPPISNPLPPVDEPALLSLADVPASERSSLPALKITMHVYAEQPAQRFMIIDGQRVGEGARLADGVILIHIRHDGAEIDAHGQRLLLPKP